MSRGCFPRLGPHFYHCRCGWAARALVPNAKVPLYRRAGAKAWGQPPAGDTLGTALVWGHPPSAEPPSLSPPPARLIVSPATRWHPAQSPLRGVWKRCSIESPPTFYASPFSSIHWLIWLSLTVCGSPIGLKGVAILAKGAPQVWPRNGNRVPNRFRVSALESRPLMIPSPPALCLVFGVWRCQSSEF